MWLERSLNICFPLFLLVNSVDLFGFHIGNDLGSPVDVVIRGSVVVVYANFSTSLLRIVFSMTVVENFVGGSDDIILTAAVCNLETI